MFRPSGTPQYNPKFLKKYSLKFTEFESVIFYTNLTKQFTLLQFTLLTKHFTLIMPAEF